MSARLAIAALFCSAAFASTTAPTRVYVVRWANAPAEHRALVAQADQQLRDGLRREGAFVAEGRNPSPGAIVLAPRLEVYPGALKLSVVGLRGSDRSLLGTFSTKASGSTRAAQLRAVVQRACHEAAAFE